MLVETIVDILQKRSLEEPDSTAFTYIDDKDVATSITYAALYERCTRLSVGLSQQVTQGECVLLFYPSGLDFICALLACFKAGIIAVPLYPPRLNHNVRRIASILQSSKAGTVLTCAKHIDRVSTYIKSCNLVQDIAIIDTNSLRVDSIDYPEASSCCDIAFVQYTSGSTDDPKGVMVGHDNVISNLTALVSQTGVNSKDIFVNWLPLFHDLGLINTILLPLYIGAHSVIISPAHFIRRPAAWLELISSYGGTVCGAPNFAYALCVEKAVPEADVDLSSWRIAFNAAEPINPETVSHFSEKFSRFGFNPNAHYPSFGMAEATVFISGIKTGEGARIESFDYQQLKIGRAVAATKEKAGKALVSCGTAPLLHDIKIVDPTSGQPLKEGLVGEIWFSGPSVAKGYLGRQVLTDEIFGARLDDSDKKYLKTGDLGFIYDGQLYVSGRIKDVMIVNGLNYYPQDVERTAVDACEELRDGYSAAFSYEAKGKECVVLIAEIQAKHRKKLDKDADFRKEITTKIKEAIFFEHEIHLADLRIVPPNSIPMTSSGKIQRRQCKDLFLQGKFTSVSDKKVMPEAGLPEDSGSPVTKQLSEIWQQCLKTAPDATVSNSSNFFADGGDSISAIRMIAEIESRCEVKLSEDALFLHSNFSDLVKHVEALIQVKGDDNVTITATGNNKGQLSPAQSRLMVINQAMEDKAIFNLPVIVDFPSINLDVLQNALLLLLKKHEALRTAYETDDGQFIQHVLEAGALSIPVVDLRNLSEKAVANQLEILQNQEAERQFRLELGDLVSIVLVRLPQDAVRLLFTVHHIACDIWSMRLLLRDLNDIYHQLLLGTEAESKLHNAKAARYIDYCQWQRSRLEKDSSMVEALEAYWKSYLQGAPLLLNLPYSYARPKVQTYNGKEIERRLAAETIQAFKICAQVNETTPFVVGLTAYYLLLGLLSNQEDLVVGTDIANRNQASILETVGFFVNQMAMRVSLSGNPTLNTVLERVKQSVVGAHKHQELPFDRLIDILDVPRAADHSPLFQVKFLLSAMPDDELEKLGAKLEHKESRFSQYDLTLNLESNSLGEYLARIHFNRDLFSQAQANRILSCYLDILQILIGRNDYHVINVYKIVGEKYSSDFSLQGTIKPRSTDMLLHQIERAAGADPQGYALICTETRLTYVELITRVSQLANFLHGLDLEADSPVAILLDRGTDMIISMLACLKIGHPFIPIDLDFPAERIQNILEESAASVLISSQRYEDHYAEYYGCILKMEAIKEAVSRQAIDYRGYLATPDRAAYILFTSGSEGKPKGVVVKHSSLMNLCEWYIEFSSMGSSSKVLHVIPFCFDAAIKNILAPLATGASLILYDKNKLNTKEVVEFCRREKSTHLNCVPSVLNALIQEGKPQDFANISSFEFVALGAEILDLAKLAPWIKSRSFKATIANIYGPTECTDICCAYSSKPASLIERLEEKSGFYSLPIGMPITNVNGYIVGNYEGEDYINFPGVPGELFIAGECLSEGYLHNSRLTEKHFVKRPFANERLYKTGDLVRLDESGQIWFLGRRDHQIKHNGIRIEAQEIELALSTCNGVTEARVLQKDKILAAIVVSRSLMPPTSEEMLSHLARKLPFRALPNTYIVLSEFPLLPSGKVNLNKLYQILDNEIHKVVEFVQPQSPEEKIIASIYAKTLGVEKVGLNDGFFSLGGDSISAIQVISLAKEHGFTLSVPHIFEHQTVSQLANFCKANRDLAVAQYDEDGDEEEAVFDMLSADDLSRLKERVTE